MPNGRGGSVRQRRSHTYPWRENVHCQRCFTHGSRQEYFEVAASSPNEDETAPVCAAPDMAGRGHQELERIIEKQREIARQQAVAEPEQMSDNNPWLERLEWAHHLAGFTFEEMIPWAALLQEEEITLQRICSSFTRTINVAQQLILSQRCTFFSGVEINRKEEGKTPVRPFQARMGDDTKERYCEAWQR